MNKISFLIGIVSFFNSFSQEHSIRYSQEEESYFLSGTNRNNKLMDGRDSMIVHDSHHFLVNSPFSPSSFNFNFNQYFRNTPYYQNKWYRGSLISENEKITQGFIAFNLQTNSLFFSEDSNHQFIELKPREFELNGKVFRIYKDVYKQAGSVYYEQLTKGKVEIFKQYYCALKIRNNDGYRESRDGYDGEFVKESRYFTINANKMTRIDKNFDVFGLFAPQAKEYAIRENLKLSRESDLIKIAEFINQRSSLQEMALK